MSIRVIGNALLIVPIDEQGQLSPSGIVQVNFYKKPTLKFRVLAVGPGEFVKKKKRRVWRTHDVNAGDFIISRALLDGHVVRHSFDDGTGRMLINADGALAVYGFEQASAV